MSKPSKPPPTRNKVLSCSICHISNGLFKKKWKIKELAVYEDGFLEIYADKDSTEIESKINLKTVYRYILFGNNIKLFHIKDLPQSTNVSMILGYPKDYLKTKMKFKWVQFKSEDDYNKFKDIVKELTTYMKKPKFRRQTSSRSLRSIAESKLNQSFEASKQQDTSFIDPSSNDMTEFIL